MNTEPATVSGKPKAGWFTPGTITDLAIIVLLWILAVGAVKPVGEFPLNDDWSYSLAAKRLAEGEGYQPTGWTEMNLLSHAAWGALFCLPAGFSFTALRFSTLSLSLIGVLGLYGLIRQLHPSRGRALVCALALLFNAAFFSLANTFMADVPFTALAILSASFYVRYLKQEGWTNLWLGTLFALIATLSRQMGLCLPIGFGVALWLKHGLAKERLGRALLPLLLCVGAHIILQYWLRAAGKTPTETIMAERLWKSVTHPLKLPINVAYYGWSMLMYLGWFLLPLTVLLFAGWARLKEGFTRFSWVALVLWGFGLTSLGRFVFMPKLMPVHSNIISPEGIGPATLRDVFTLKLPHLSALPMGFWLIVTVLSLAGAILLLFKLTVWIRENFVRLRPGRLEQRPLLGAFFLVCAAVYLGPFIISGFFDRYLIPVMVFLMAFLAVTTDANLLSFQRSKSFVVSALLLALGVFSVTATHDYMEWNRTRWQAVRQLLTEEKLQPEDVDGGFEVNGWYLFSHDNQPERWGNTPSFFAWTEKVPYVIAYGEIDGFEIRSSHSYQRWLLPSEGKILVLKRKPTQ